MSGNNRPPEEPGKELAGPFHDFLNSVEEVDEAAHVRVDATVNKALKDPEFEIPPRTFDDGPDPFGMGWKWLYPTQADETECGDHNGP